MSDKIQLRYIFVVYCLGMTRFACNVSAVLWMAYLKTDFEKGCERLCHKIRNLKIFIVIPQKIKKFMVRKKSPAGKKYSLP